MTMSNESIDLPEGWEMIVLGELGEWSSGGTPSRKNPEYYDGNIPWVKTGDLDDGLIEEIEETITNKGLANSSAKVFPSGSLIVAMYGATIGKLGILSQPAATNQACAVLKSKDITTDLIAYLFYYLLERREDLRMIGQGGAQPNISQTILKEYPCPLPPIAEQKRIVAKIEELRSRTQKAREALEVIPYLCDRFRQSVLAAAFRGDLTADWREENPNVEPAKDLFERIKHNRRKTWEDFESKRLKARGKVLNDDKWKKKYEEPKHNIAIDLPELPSQWCWVKWEQVGLCQNGRAFPSKEYQTEGVKLLRPGNLHVSGSVKWDEANTKFMSPDWAIEYPDYLIKENELVINLTAQSLADEFLGRICLTTEHEECLLNQRIARLTPILILPKFMLWLLKSKLFRSYVDELNTGSLIQHMFTSQIDEFYFPLPPLDEQNVIVQLIEARLSAVEKIRSSAEETVKFLPVLDRAILTKAFRGELVPQDPNNEPASVLLERIREERAKKSDRMSTKRKR
ncbi:restriction endonuclease subunit S [Pseudanabaenaceae cyanobacterium LEGE 13415]|nr:restriction endonuclease subunit S [Pseudanabaenaceae cyanobacterium LEGE 13415]